MSVALSTAFPPLRTPDSDATLISDVRCAPTEVRYAPWGRVLPAVTAELGFFKYTRAKPLLYMYEPPTGIAQQNCHFELVPVPISDARHLGHRARIDIEGFELWEAPTKVVDFWNDHEVTAKYYAEATELVKGVTGASEVIVFDHQVRQREAGRPSLTFGRTGDGSKAGAVGRVHVDYSEVTGRKRLQLVLGDQASVHARGRFAIVNVWRSIKGPVLDTPLAVCDARSVGIDDLVAANIRYQTRSGEIYLLRHSSRHRWYYYSAMDRNEALIFKQYDSLINGVSRFTPHGAFDLPEVDERTPVRESIEVRCLVIY